MYVVGGRRGFVGVQVAVPTFIEANILPPSLRLLVRLLCNQAHIHCCLTNRTRESIGGKSRFADPYVASWSLSSNYNFSGVSGGRMSYNLASFISESKSSPECSA